MKPLTVYKERFLGDPGAAARSAAKLAVYAPLYGVKALGTTATERVNRLRAHWVATLIGINEREVSGLTLNVAYGRRCPTFEFKTPPATLCQRWFCPFCRGRKVRDLTLDLARRLAVPGTRFQLWQSTIRTATGDTNPHSLVEAYRAAPTGNDLASAAGYRVVAGYVFRQPEFQKLRHHGETWVLRTSVVGVVDPAQVPDRLLRPDDAGRQAGVALRPGGPLPGLGDAATRCRRGPGPGGAIQHPGDQPARLCSRYGLSADVRGTMTAVQHHETDPTPPGEKRRSTGHRRRAGNSAEPRKTFLDSTAKPTRRRRVRSDDAVAGSDEIPPAVAGSEATRE